MVDLMTAVLAFLAGVLLFVGIAALAPALPVGLQVSIGDWYYKNWMRGMGATVLVWRLLGTPELKSIQIDDEKDMAEAVLTSGTLTDDVTLPFRDPDDRLKELYRKPFGIVFPLLPSIVDAELAEYASGVEAEGQNGRLKRQKGVVQPYVPVSDGLRAVNPKEVMFMVMKGIQPEVLKTAEDITKSRFSEYGGMPGLKESFGMTVAFAIGAGGAVGAFYVREEVLGGGGGGSPIGGGTINIPPTTIDVALDALAVIA